MLNNLARSRIAREHLRRVAPRVGAIGLALSVLEALRR
jgi:hypothetical protein